MFKKLICRIKGHKRGKRISNMGNGIATYSCPRCGAQWMRKVKA